MYEAADGRSGMALFSQVIPALVITDIVMPDKEGIETIGELRSKGASIPIPAISGDSSPLYLKAATELGATASLEKSFSAGGLLSIVAELLDTS